jgi:DNA modification methylase
MKGLEIYDVRDIKVTVTSPPYFDARNYGGEALFANQEDWIRWCFNGIIKISQRTKKDGVIWWNTGSGYKNYRKMIGVYKLVVALDMNGIFLIDEIPWVKKSAPPKKIRNRPHPAWEHNFIFATHPSKVTFYRDNVRRPYAPATLSRMKYKVGKLASDLDGEYPGGDKMVNPNPKGATPPNYLLLPQDTSRRPHPAPMVPDLANWAIRAYSQEGDLVFDPMAGGGTTWVEAERLGREFIGFELFPEYIEMANMSIDRLRRGDDPYNGLRKEWEEAYAKI